jgi:hypothetical protein
VRPVSDKPLDLDKHRGMAEQKATDIRTREQRKRPVGLIVVG